MGYGKDPITTVAPLFVSTSPERLTPHGFQWTLHSDGWGMQENVALKTTMSLKSSLSQVTAVFGEGAGKFLGRDRATGQVLRGWDLFREHPCGCQVPAPSGSRGPRPPSPWTQKRAGLKQRCRRLPGPPGGRPPVPAGHFRGSRRGLAGDYWDNPTLREDFCFS